MFTDRLQCICAQEICYRLEKYNVRGTSAYVEKGCRDASSCTLDMYIGRCNSNECIRCLDNPLSCSGPRGNNNNNNYYYY